MFLPPHLETEEKDRSLTNLHDLAYLELHTQALVGRDRATTASCNLIRFGNHRANTDKISWPARKGVLVRGV
jgi:hypothetical protein